MTHQVPGLLVLQGTPEREGWRERKKVRGSRSINHHMYQGDLANKMIKNNDLRQVQEVLVVPAVHHYPADPEKRR